MKIISFAETTPALLAGVKTVTRRDWTEAFARGIHAGDFLQAWDKNPRVHGKRVGTIRILRDPYLEATTAIPAGDWDAEGFEYLMQHDLTLFGGQTPLDFWNAWKAGRGGRAELYVVRFELVEIMPDVIAQTTFRAIGGADFTIPLDATITGLEVSFQKPRREVHGWDPR